jgi:energy-coupling factor transporter ATP-binding protein EcfA2
MKLVDLDIQRMPGFEEGGFAYRDLKEGVHVIWGPNGSGKTTTCKAIKALLWPNESPKLHPVLLQSRWQCKAELIDIAKEGSWLKMPEELKAKLMGTSCHAYFFALDDLFEDREKDLVKLFINEMHGGYDFSDLWQQVALTPRFGFLEANQVANQKLELEKVKREQARIVQNESKLLHIEEEIEASQAAIALRTLVESALECAKLKKETEAVVFKGTWLPWFFLLLGLSILMFFFFGYWALLPLMLSALFLKRHLQEKSAMQKQKAHLEGRLSQAMLKVTKKKHYLDCSIEELEEEMKKLSSVASNLPYLLEEKKQIEQEVQMAILSKSFEAASVKIESAKEAFAKKREHAKKVLLARAFLKRVQERYENERQPLVLQKAAEYFRLFSLGSFDLHALKNELFRIWDRKNERYCKQEELSYGIRVQLLLALRLGFLWASEKGLGIPLFMDEILCHVDDDRFAVVSEAILQIGKERQVFLFTCQRYSFEVWKNLGAHGIDLEEIQGKQRKQRTVVSFVSAMKLAREPHPDEDKRAYAQEMGLLAPSLDLKFTDQPSWTLLKTASDIYRMHASGVKTLGHLLAISSDEEHREKAQVLKKALELGKIGKAKEVTRSDLEHAAKEGVFSRSFLDAVDECCKKNRGDAKKLLDALEGSEVKRFLTRYKENLKEYFLDHGFLDLREPLSEEQMRDELCQLSTSHSLENVEFISYLLSVFVANKSSGMSQL